MEATIAVQMRIGVDEAEGLARITSPRGKNQFLRKLLRDELQRRGILKAAPGAPKKSR